MKVMGHREAMLLSVIECYPGLTACEIREEYLYKSGDDITRGSLYTTLHRMNYDKTIKSKGRQGSRTYKLAAKGNVLLRNYRGWTKLV
jgi:DNA-binding PadR family transcriptional regulator